MRRFLPLVVVLATVTVACTAGGSDDQRASDLASSIVATVDDVVAAAPLEAGLVVPEGCELEETFDDYGFAVEIVVCPDERHGSTTPTVATLDDYLGSVEARRLTVAIRNALIIDAGCEADSVLALDAALASGPPEIRVRLAPVAEELASAARACGDRWSAWERHMSSAAGHLEELVRFLDTEGALE